ncbi:MAG TPA: c-type cytochrome [Candidatus Acidoferrales bacterium]|nr:c-type cytochrome [Candidatus Acidoferrales bacterium]
MRFIVVAIVMMLGFASATRAETVQATSGGRGEEIYTEFCASCHGKYGRGDGQLAGDLKRPLPDFTDSARYAGRTDDDITKALVAASHGPMSVASVLKPDSLKAAVAYIRNLSTPGKHVSVLAGRDIYNAAGCWGCHGIKGDGHGPIAQALGEAKPRDFTSPKFVIEGHEDEIARSISLGAEKAIHGSKYMPEWSSRLSPQEISDVVAYIATLKTR